MTSILPEPQQILMTSNRWLRRKPLLTLPHNSPPDRAADPGEEVTLGVAFELIRRDLFDAPLVHVAGRDQPLRDQVVQPLGGIRLELVVVSCHWLSCPLTPRFSGRCPGRSPFSLRS